MVGRCPSQRPSLPKIKTDIETGRVTHEKQFRRDSVRHRLSRITF